MEEGGDGREKKRREKRGMEKSRRGIGGGGFLSVKLPVNPALALACLITELSITLFPIMVPSTAFRRDLEFVLHAY